MKPLISLIIPVYNVEPYLDNCMKSVMNQTYENYEVLLVDDGSTDKSGIICDRYAEIDKRICVFHKENRGLSDARNFGVERAKGRLIAFVDSDDYVSDDYLEYLYYLMEKYDADMSFCRLTRVREKDVPKIICAQNVEDTLLSPEDLMKHICGCLSACAKLLKKDFLVTLPFPVGKLYEDIATLYKIAAVCKNAAFGTKNIYFYVTRTKGSIRYSPMNDEKLSILEGSESQLDYIKKNYPGAIDNAVARCCHNVIELLDTTDILAYKKTEDKYFGILKDYLKKHTNRIWNNHAASFSLKISCAIVLMGYYPAKIFWPVRKKMKDYFNK